MLTTLVRAMVQSHQVIDMGKQKDNSSVSRKEEKSLEEMYTDIFNISPATTVLEDTSSLEQPSMYYTVQTVTTYGAYEKPI